MNPFKPAGALALATICIIITGCAGRPGRPMHMGLPVPESHREPLPGTVAGPSASPELKHRAAVALNNGQNDRARSLYQRAVKECPDDAEARLGLANALHRLGYHAPASEHAQWVMCHGGCHTPYAAQLEVTLQSTSGNYADARAAAVTLAQWADANRQPLQAVDGYLTASRISAYNLNDGPSTWKYLNLAKAQVRPGDEQAATRIANHERALKRDCLWARLNGAT